MHMFTAHVKGIRESSSKRDVLRRATSVSFSVGDQHQKEITARASFLITLRSIESIFYCHLLDVYFKLSLFYLIYAHSSATQIYPNI